MYNDLTLEKLPEAITFLIKTVDELKMLLVNTETKPIENRVPIGIDKACWIVQKAKSTIYSLARKGLIPCYKKGKKKQLIRLEKR